MEARFYESGVRCPTATEFRASESQHARKLFLAAELAHELKEIGREVSERARSSGGLRAEGDSGSMPVKLRLLP